MLQYRSNKCFFHCVLFFGMESVTSLRIILHFSMSSKFRRNGWTFVYRFLALDSTNNSKQKKKSRKSFDRKCLLIPFECETLMNFTKYQYQFSTLRANESPFNEIKWNNIPYILRILLKKVIIRMICEPAMQCTSNSNVCLFWRHWLHKIPHIRNAICPKPIKCYHVLFGFNFAFM